MFLYLAPVVYWSAVAALTLLTLQSSW